MANIAIYVHWPYCARICPYCDFNVYKQRRDDGLVDAICQDIAEQAQRFGPRTLTSVHFGGGTPSLLEVKSIEQIIKEASQHYEIGPDCEIAIEANPQDADAARWKAYAKAGINRLSLGVQSFHDPALNLLGRDHSGAQAQEALSMAVSIFPSVSLDLIFGWSGQTETLLQQDLDIALSSGAQHISAYQLTIENGTAFAKAEARGDIKSVSSDTSADFYELIQKRLMSEGFDHYEVSNFAKPSHRSRHNLTYWQGGDYIGAGPGAHGRLTVDGTRFATIASMRPEDYKKTALQEKIVLTPTEWAEEYLLMGLRIEEGISLSRFEEIGGHILNQDMIENFVSDKLITYENDRLKVTASGRLVLNRITEKLLVG